MRLQTIHIENFRCFEALTLTLNPQMNILIGNNGTGKTAIVEAISKIIANAFPLNITNPTLPLPQKDDKDIRYISKSTSKESVSLEAVKLNYLLENGKGHTFDYKEDSWNSSFLLNMRDINELLISAKTDSTINLPLFAYYPAHRNWNIAKSEKDYEKGSRLEGYKDWFTPNVNTAFVVSWLKNRESADLQQKNRKPNGAKVFEMGLIRKVAQTCIPNCNDIYYDFDETQLMMEIAGQKLPFSLLSSGFQNMLAIVMDLVFRCSRLNPHLQENACLKTEGIVLIDEIDLHLHPKWQKQVVQNLHNAFPNIQFVVTTHSPLILSGGVGNVIKLNENNEPEYLENVFGRDVADILEVYQETDPEYEQTKSDFSQYFSWIEAGEGKSEKALTLRKSLEDKLGKHYHKFAEADVMITFYE